MDVLVKYIFSSLLYFLCLYGQETEERDMAGEEMECHVVLVHKGELNQAPIKVH